MKVNSIGNTNYSPNFGLKIGEKALVGITDQISNDRTKLFSNTPDVLSTIKKFGSEKVEMSEFTANKEYNYYGSLMGYTVDYKLRYTLGDKTYSKEYYTGDSNYWYPSQEVPYPVYGYCFDYGKKDILNSTLNKTHSDLIAFVIESLAKEGNLKNNIDKIKQDFPNDKKFIKQKYEMFKSMDEEAPKLLEIKKAEDVAKQAAKEAKKLEYRKRHPILCRLFGNKYQ